MKKADFAQAVGLLAGALIIFGLLCWAEANPVKAAAVAVLWVVCNGAIYIKQNQAEEEEP